MRSAIRSYLQLRNESIGAYGSAVTPENGAPSLARIRAVVPSQWVIEIRNGHPALKVDQGSRPDTWLPLPSTEMIEAPSARHTDTLSRLVRTRSRLARELASYDGQDSELVAAMLILSAFSEESQ